MNVIFWREKVIHSRRPDVDPHQVVLVPIPAILVGPSDVVIGQRCAVCREPEEGHARRGRRHAFFPMVDPGVTIDVHYPDEPVERRHNVMRGRAANCWTEKE